MAEPTELPPGARPDPAAHPRDAEVEEAARDLLTFLKPWYQRHSLSHHEYCYLLGTAVLRQLQRACVDERETRPPRIVGEDNIK